MLTQTPLCFPRVHTLLLRGRRQVRDRPQQRPQARRLGGEQHCTGSSGAPQEGLRLLPQQFPGRCLPLPGVWLLLCTAFQIAYQIRSSTAWVFHPVFCWVGGRGEVLAFAHYRNNRCCDCCLVAQSCPTLCHPTDRSTPGLPVLHYLPEFAHVHWVAIVNDKINISVEFQERLNSPRGLLREAWGRGVDWRIFHWNLDMICVTL